MLACCQHPEASLCILFCASPCRHSMMDLTRLPEQTITNCSWLQPELDQLCTTQLCALAKACWKANTNLHFKPYLFFVFWGLSKAVISASLNTQIGPELGPDPLQAKNVKARMGKTGQKPSSFHKGLARRYRLPGKSSKYTSCIRPWKTIPFHPSSNMNYSMKELGRQTAWARETINYS